MEIQISKLTGGNSDSRLRLAFTGYTDERGKDWEITGATVVTPEGREREVNPHGWPYKFKLKVLRA